MTPRARAAVWSMTTMNAVMWAAIGVGAATGRTHYPWWVLPVVMGSAAVTGLFVGRRIARDGGGE